MTAAIIAADYDAAYEVATSLGLGHDWMHLREVEQTQLMTFTRLVIVGGWIEGGATVELYEAAVKHLAPGAPITGGAMTRTPAAPFVEVLAVEENYTPRHMARDKTLPWKRAAAALGGSIIGVGLALWFTTAVGWLTW